MSDKQWFNYKGQSLDTLLAAEVSHRVDSIVVAIDSAIQMKWERQGEDALTAEERLVYRAERLESELANGGFALFFDAHPECAMDIVHDLERIGCAELSNLLREALAVLSATTLSENAVMDAMQRLGEPGRLRLDSLSDRFWEVYRARENIADAVLLFIRKNRSQFHL